MKVVYVLNTFPDLIQTFILYEMVEMQKKGVEIEVFSHVTKAQNITQPELKEIKKLTYFPKDIKLSDKIYAHLYWLVRHPLRYLRVYWLLIHSKISPSENCGLGGAFFSKLFYTVMIDRAKPDQTHAHFGDYSSNLVMLYYLLTRTPYTFMTHSYDIFNTPPKNYRLKSRLAVKHLTISEYNKKYLIDTFGIGAGHIQVIHCGVNFNKIPAGERREEKNAILTVARLHQEKGLDVLIRACRLLKDQGISFSCSIIGKGDEKENLERLIQELGLTGEVKLLGQKMSGELFELLKKSTLMVLPSRLEGIPVSLMEAMALKTPVISTAIYGIPELIEDGKSGFLVPPDRPELLAEKIKALVSDENLRKRFAESGYQKVREDFNLQKETDKLLNLWKTARGVGITGR